MAWLNRLDVYDDTVMWLRIVNGKPSGIISGGFMNLINQENTLRVDYKPVLMAAKKRTHLGG